MTKAAELAALIGSQMAQSNRNIVINGAMNIAQYSTSETGLGASSGYFTIDRFRMVSSNTAGRFTMSQASVTDLPEFANALKDQITLKRKKKPVIEGPRAYRKRIEEEKT